MSQLSEDRNLYRKLLASFVIVLSGLLGKCLLCFGTVACPHEAYIGSKNLSPSSSGKLRTHHFIQNHLFLPFSMHHVHASATRMRPIIHYYPENLYPIKPSPTLMTLYPSFSMNNAH